MAGRGVPGPPTPIIPGPMRVLLTGARAPATLELARLCARAGHTVHVADTGAWHVCRGSRLVTASHRLPAPRAGHDAYAQALQALADRLHLDVIVPTCEEVFHLAAVRDRLTQVRVLCEPLPRLALLHDKWRFIEACAAAGLAVPRTHRLDAYVPAHGAWILKPRFSRFATRVRTWHGGKVLPDLDGDEPARWIAQELLTGEPLCTWSVVRDGTVQAHATYAVDATAGARGAAIAFHAVQHAGVLDWVQQFCRAHRLGGQFAFDFIDTADGLRAIECNPRLTSGVHCFRDVPAVADVLLGVMTPAAAPLQPPADIAFRSRLALAMYAHGRRAGAGLLDATDDPWPRRLQLVSWADLLLRAAVRRQDPRRLSTADIEWNGE